MSEKKKVEVEEALVVSSNAPATLISQGMAKGVDLDKLSGLLDIQIKWEANEAKKAFILAMAEFKLEPPVITRDKKNKQYDSSYSSLENFVNTTIPFLSKNGLSHGWTVEQPDNKGIKVTCTITHSAGHSDSTSMTAPPDESGKKNVIQQIKSTVTYLKLATFEAITGLASEDGGLDDDGNGPGARKKVEPVKLTPGLFADKQSEIGECTDKSLLSKWIAKNKVWIDTLDEEGKDKIRKHCQEYLDIFNEEEKNNND